MAVFPTGSCNYTDPSAPPLMPRSTSRGPNRVFVAAPRTLVPVTEGVLRVDANVVLNETSIDLNTSVLLLYAATGMSTTGRSKDSDGVASLGYIVLTVSAVTKGRLVYEAAIPLSSMSVIVEYFVTVDVGEGIWHGRYPAAGAVAVTVI